MVEGGGSKFRVLVKKMKKIIFLGSNTKIGVSHKQF